MNDKITIIDFDIKKMTIYHNGEKKTLKMNGVAPVVIDDDVTIVIEYGTKSLPTLK